MKKTASILLIILSLTCCRMPESIGFYQPITMSLAVPDGPPEYQAGWHAGCTTALSQKAFSNSAVYRTSKGPDLGNGIYQHDPVFQTGWGQGWFACVLHIGDFVDFNSFKYSALD